MEQASKEFDFSTYVIPARLRTRVAVTEDQIEVRCPVIWAPVSTSRVLYRFGLWKITGVRIEQVFDRVSAGLAAIVCLVGMVAVFMAIRTGALLTGVVTAVAAVVVAGVAVIVGARTRVWIQTERDGLTWFDVAATEQHEAARFGDWLVHHARLSAGRRVPQRASGA